LRFRSLFLAAALAALIAPGLAHAAVRVATITDPQDALPAAPGAQKNPDLKSIELEYDANAGTVTATVTFYESVSARTDDTVVTFHLGSTPGPSNVCNFDLDVPHATGVMYVHQGVNFLQVERVDQIMQSARSSLSADGLTYTATWTSRPNLGGKDYRCADVASVSWSYYTTPGCNYASCPTATADLDPVYKETWFDGFAPVPAAPTNVSVASASDTSIALSWRDDDTSVTGYEVLEEGKVVGTTDKTGFTVTDLSCGKAYDFSVRADTQFTHSAGTAVSASTKACAPKAPAHLSVAAKTTSVTVSWGASANATGYVVVVGSRTYRTTAKRLVVTGLHCGQRVTVKVRAVGPGGTSPTAQVATRTRHC
jgi:hypothetical protein